MVMGMMCIEDGHHATQSNMAHRINFVLCMAYLAMPLIGRVSGVAGMRCVIAEGAYRKVHHGGLFSVTIITQALAMVIHKYSSMFGARSLKMNIKVTFVYPSYVSVYLRSKTQLSIMGAVLPHQTASLH